MKVEATTTVGVRPVSRSVRRQFNALMRLIRRAHMYAGLFMTPWVFLYGVTALLFNHPEVLATRELRWVGLEQLRGTALEELPPAEAVAAEVVAEFNRRDPENPLRLDPGAAAAYRGALFAEASRGPGRVDLRWDLESRQGVIAARQGAPPAAGGPAAGPGSLKVESLNRERLERGAWELLKGAGIVTQTARIRRGPEVVFEAMQGDRRWRIHYEPVTGQLRSEPAEAGSGRSLSPRDFLVRLHRTASYPGQLNVAWFWAVAVDAMFISMVGWGMTGLLMWWQMKNLRWSGLWVLAASAVLATVLFVGMHQRFVEG
ncbi:MAG: hypothetical protein KatS3mg108_1988 [Isosphaeraceae bacterium]|nr:MAG: hypothetical protein KatS3mg108_1988 [Isosphaeraceae bacterium]